MSDSSASQASGIRDGASQASRALAALRPEYAPVDERSLNDLLAFAQQYAKGLRYFNEHNQDVGDWSPFLPTDLDRDEVVAFMQEPGAVPPEKARRYRRPHFVLFLTFLHLLRHAQDHLNSLTRRHLDFYYQQVLGMTKLPGVPDQVNILVDLAPGTEPFALPEGTHLSAGTDSLGQDVFYRTDREIVVNHAQVERLSSVYWEIDVNHAQVEQPSSVDAPQQEAWRNLYPAADATTVSIGPGLATAAETPRWRTFGQRQPSVPEDSPPPATIGWAISSPLLALSQGKRTITLTLWFQAEQFGEKIIRGLFMHPAEKSQEKNQNAINNDAGPFRIQVSTEKGWIEPDTINVTKDIEDQKQKLKTLKFTLSGSSRKFLHT